jgi:hydroxymethylpyrimidine/phosphomethylpyrimidine kinase
VAAGVAAVLVKGGHLPGAEATDTLVWGDDVRRFARPRARGGDVRGTGCALATAIAVALGRGAQLAGAVLTATTWIGGAIERARDVGDERHLG